MVQQSGTSGTVISTGPRKRWVWFAGTALVLALVGAAGFFYFRPAQAFTESDYILLVDFVNTTGEPVFDGALKQALAVQLEQSPFLNIVSQQRVRETLRYMGRSPDERVTTPVAREICQRQGIRAMIACSIESLGSSYVITLNAEDSRTGESLGREQVEAAGKEKVLTALGKAASRLRRKLGESLSSLEKFGAPIRRATTSSLEALRAFSLGLAQRTRGRDAESIPFFKRAIELDPNFALAYGNLGTAYGNLGEGILQRAYTKKAYERRERVSEPEKFYITAHYYNEVTGETDKAIDAYELWKQTYPRHFIPRNNLAVAYNGIGEFEKGVQEAREALRLAPNEVNPYSNLAYAYSCLNRFAEAKIIREQQIAQGIEDAGAHIHLYEIAFIRGDIAAMERHAKQVAGKPRGGLWMLRTQAEAAAFHGKVPQARELMDQSIQLDLRNNFKERAAYATALDAWIAAHVGNMPEARERTAAALAIAGGIGVETLAAQALGLAGDINQAAKIADDLAERFPKNTLLHAVGLPTVRGIIEIQRGNSVGAIELLEAASPYELGYQGLRAIYVRGQAYLGMRAGVEAAVEFQKILDHRGVAPVSPLYALAHLGLGRAYALTGGQAASGTRAKSRRFYQDFFAIWKDADPDIPILKEARAEYATLK